MTVKKNVSLFLLMIITLVLIACQNPGGDPITPTDPAEEIVPTNTFLPTELPQPTATDTPKTILFYTPETMIDTVMDEVQAWLADWAGEKGYVLETRTRLDTADIPAETLAVVILNESGVDVNTLAPQHPQTRFIVKRTIRIENPPDNVVVLLADDNTLNFAAGFISILIAPDWRLGALLPWNDEIRGADTLEAFLNGSAYYCGRCASTYMPVALFPVTSSLSIESAPETWIEAINTLDNQYYLYTVYVSPEAASQQLYQHLVTLNVTVVGAEKPEGVEGLLWAGSIHQDTGAALTENWEAIINDSLESNTILVPVSLSEVNEEYLSPGRMRLFDEMMDALLDGWISPLSPDYP
ncbi:MAG: hypothetical protein V2J07_05350 [Anaerolineae bacterium]|jgi:hypothetical protein|nr:hypothetical protein [Anaerolineae bacterium]